MWKKIAPALVVAALTGATALPAMAGDMNNALGGALGGVAGAAVGGALGGNMSRSSYERDYGGRGDRGYRHRKHHHHRDWD